MATKLQQHLPECVAGEWQITTCEIQHPRYKTYLSPENQDRAFLSLVYHLHGKSPSSVILENRILYAKVYLGDYSRQIFAITQQTMNRHAESGVIHLSELGMVAWRFPADPAMPWLAELVDLKRASTLIFRHHSNSALVAIEIINYRPETRCTARYSLRSATSFNPTSLYGKIYADQNGQAIYANLLAISAQSQHAEAFVVPSALSYDPFRHTLWLQGLDGVPLISALFGPDSLALISQLCRALARFQQISLPQLALITPTQNLFEWQKKAQKLNHSYKELRVALQNLLDELQTDYGDSAEFGLIHGDFHIGQLALLESGRIALFDYDELAFGDPLQDLANFAADLYNQQPIADVDQLVDKLFNAYWHATDGKASVSRFYWQLRGQLLTRAYRAHIQQRPDTALQVARFIALANRPAPEVSELYIRNSNHDPD